MADISVHGFDGASGGRDFGQSIDRVAPQPDFANMTLEQIQAWEAANNSNPLTDAVPAAAVVPPHATEASAAAAYAAEQAAIAAQRAEESGTKLELVPEAGYQLPEPQDVPEPAELVRAEFSLGEPFVHVVAYLTAGPVEIIATPDEALELYTKLGLALGAAQRAGVIA
jgi:hypothetical protein